MLINKLHFPFLILAWILIACNTASKDWEKALEANEIESYEKFREMHPNSNYADSAIIQIWILTEKLNTIAGYENYLTKYQLYRNTALEKIWVLTTDSNTIESYEMFLNRHPDNQYAETAIHSIWDITQKINTPKAYEAFIGKYPESKYYDQALKGLWQLTKETKSIKACNDFIAKYPKTTYAQEARDEIKKIFSSSTSNSPSAKINTNLSVDININSMADADSYKIYWTRSSNERIRESQSLNPTALKYSNHWPDGFPVYYYVVALKDGAKSKISTPFIASLKSSNNGKNCQLCGASKIGYCSDRRIYVCSSHNVYTSKSGRRIRCP